MVRTKPSRPLPITNYLSSIGTIIDQKVSVRDLGVIVSNDATFSGHINHVIEIANKTTGLILRSFKSRSKDLMITLWKSLWKSSEEYCSQL